MENEDQIGKEREKKKLLPNLSGWVTVWKRWAQAVLIIGKTLLLLIIHGKNLIMKLRIAKL